MTNDWAVLRSKVRRFIGRRVASDAVAEELTQETFMRLLRAGARPQNPEAWLLTAARRLVIDHYRTRREHAPLDTELPAESAAVPVYERLADCLPAMLARLPATYRSALALADLEGLSQQAVAAQQGISLPGAKSRVQRGRRLLAEAYRACCALETGNGGGLVDFSERVPGACIL